jgi:hypothetical protein
MPFAPVEETVPAARLPRNLRLLMRFALPFLCQALALTGNSNEIKKKKSRYIYISHRKKRGGKGKAGAIAA